MNSPAGAGETTARSFWTLERKVPVLVWALLTATVAVGIAVSYGAVRTAGREAAEERLGRVNQQLSAMIGASFSQSVPAFRSVAEDERISAYLRDPGGADTAAVIAALGRVGPLGRGAVHLRTADGVVLLGASAAADTLAVPGFPGVDPGTGLSPVFIDGDRGAYWAAAPVRENERTIGWITSYVPITGGAARTVLTLIGRGSTMAFASRSGGAWVGITGEPFERPVAGIPRPGAVVQYRDSAGSDRIIRIDTVANTPWIAGVSMPLDRIDEAANRFLRRASLVAVLLTLIGAAAAWAISRRITKPILSLRSAALAIAGGEYTRRVPDTRRDEIGDLARTFNEMTTHIQAAHDELEHRYERAQSLALELEIANEELEEAIAETDAMRERAQEANRAKSDFLATMSHEIRTPINAMIGYADLLELGIGGGISPEQQTYIDRIKASGTHLTRLVDEVLDFAKIEAGQLRVHDALNDAGHAIERAIATIEPAAREKGVAIRHGPIPHCLYRGDAQRVQQILLNLMANAVKFTQPGGWVEVTCTSGLPATDDDADLAAGHSYICITVADNGVGIPAARLADIFEPFVQGDSGYTREHGGAGLGLSISRRLARLMGGDVTAERRDDGGSAFTVWLRQAATRGAVTRGADEDRPSPAAAERAT